MKDLRRNVLGGPILIEIEQRYGCADRRWYFSITHVSDSDDDSETERVIIDIVDDGQRPVIRMMDSDVREYNIVFTDVFIEWSTTISGHVMMGIYYSLPSFDEVMDIIEHRYVPDTSLTYSYE